MLAGETFWCGAVMAHRQQWFCPACAVSGFLLSGIPSLKSRPSLSFNSTLSSCSRILTAEFQITRIEALPPFPTAEREHVLGAGGGSGDSSAKRAAFPGRVRTRVRYDLVGSGQNFHREQRVGQWELEWEAAQTSSSLVVDFRLKTWRMSDETQSRSSGPVFIDITAEAFRSNSSYSAQLLH